MQDLTDRVLTARVLRTVDLLKSDEPVEFTRIQNYFLNANLGRSEHPRLEELFPWTREGTVEERQLYERVRRLSEERSELNIRLFDAYWSRFGVGTLTMRQREVVGRVLASKHDWLLRTLPKGSTIRLFSIGPDRGYIFVTEKPTMLVKSTGFSDAEPEISVKAGELGVGPKVFHANPDYIVEDIVKTDAGLTSQLFNSPKSVGELIGPLYRSLHGSGIVYGDVFFSVRPVQVHLLFDGRRAYLVDFGGSSFSDDTDFDYRKIIISLENLATGHLTLDEDSCSRYVARALSNFSRTYGREVRRDAYPRAMSQLFT